MPVNALESNEDQTKFGLSEGKARKIIDTILLNIVDNKTDNWSTKGFLK